MRVSVEYDSEAWPHGHVLVEDNGVSLRFTPNGARRLRAHLERAIVLAEDKRWTREDATSRMAHKLKHGVRKAAL